MEPRLDDSGPQPRPPALSRRALLGLAGAGALLLVAGTAWLGGRGGGRLLRGFRVLMGTRAAILLSHPSPQLGQEAMDAAFADIAEVSGLMTRFQAASDVGRLNAGPGRWHAVSPLTAGVLATALEVARASDGHFDPCLDGIVSAWGFHDHVYPRALPAPLPRLQGNYRSLQLRTTHGGHWAGRLDSGSPGIDLGGIAKGFGIDRAVARLRELGVSHALVNVGDDLRALGGHPDGGPWRIGIRHPRRPDEVLAVLELRERAVATSGDYANYFLHGGKRYAHLIDPRAGVPAGTHQSMTVTAPTAMLADALATAASTAEPPHARRLLERLAPAPWYAVDGRGAPYSS